MKRDEIKAELDAIAKANKGMLKAADVVDFARDPETALHSQFEWDDSAAAEKHRLWQARQVISVFVTVTRSDSAPVRQFVSLQSDRSKPGGGYRYTSAVVKNKTRREELLQMAADDAERMQKKYEAYAGLADDIAADFAEVAARQVARRQSTDTRIAANA